MKFVVCLVLFLNTFSFGQSFPHIFELRGLEDSLNNTHLFYRYVYPNDHCWSKSIYHIDVVNNIDTFFIYDSGYEVFPGYGCEGDYVNDYEFFNNNFSKYIYCGYNLWIDPVALLRRYDGDIQLEAFVLTELEISKLDESLVYVSAGPGFFKSTDGGYNFVRNDSMQFIDASIISLSQNNDSQIYGIDDNKLVRSEDEGYSYIIVDAADWRDNSELFYDPDGNHIYGLSIYYNHQTHSYNSKIYKSSDNGNPFTWNTILEYPGKIWLTLDDIQAGEIYYSAGKQIFKSTDFGNTFILYKELERKITGLYKKSGTNILYASTPLRIYEITPDTISVIKNLPIPEEVLNYYPLAVGNKWVYTEKMVVNPYIEYSVEVIEVLKDSLAPNGKLYFHLRNAENHFLERVDSSEGKVYRYFESTNLPENEYMIDDLLAEVGDIVNSFRMRYPSNYSYTIVEAVNTFNKWGLTKPRKVFRQVPLYTAGLVYSLTQDIGLDYLLWGYWFATTTWTLNGCVINGVVYGDTMLVSVENETENIPTEFSLSQNYPNPFNPTTTIKFTIPTSPLNPSPYQGEGHRERLITLKVYDILGNEIATLVNEESAIGGAGSYEVEFSGKGLPSGVYFYQLRAGGFVDTKKLILIK